MTIDRITREILVEGLDDWIPVDRVIGLAYELSGNGSGDYKALTIKTIEFMLKQRFVLVGEIGAAGFEAWPGSVAAIMSRIADVLDGLEWKPQGAAFWLATTPLGDAQAQSLETH